MKIAHISDIHWRGLTRHAEFTKAFEAFFAKVSQIKPDVIFVGGDLFHTKTSGISPEVIDRLVWMLKSMGDIAETHIVLGNHDGNLANEERQDAISPIVAAIDHPKIHLHKNSTEIDLGLIGNQEARLCVFSCFDKPGWSSVTKLDDAINIATFHGSVGGTEMDNGWIMPDSKAEVPLEMFKSFDFALLGDIHKRQFLSQRPDKNGVLKPWIGYPGSPIQQNFGEEEKKGFLLWDIKAKNDWDVEFVEIPNYQPYVTLPWQGSVENTLKALEHARKLQVGARYRISSTTPLTGLLERQISHEFKSVRGAEEVVFKAERSLNYDMISHGDLVVKKRSLRNDKEVMFKFYQEFLDSNPKKFLVSANQIQQGKDAISGYLDKFNISELETTRDISWSLKEFEFSNLFRYGENNKINFDSLDGIIGVFGRNKLGKSSLIGALMYTLFNCSDREGITKNGQIMNQNKKICSGKICLTVNGADYVIERSSQRVLAPKKGKKSSEEEFDGDKTETKVSFSLVLPDGSLKSLNGITREETDKAIRKLLGNAQDFLMTSVATQSKMERFIDEGASSRKTILNRFLDLDIFEKLYGYAKEDVAAINAKTTSYSMGWEKAINDIKFSSENKERELVELETNIEEKRKALDSVRLWVSQHEAADSIEATQNLVKVQQKLFSLRRQLTKAQEDQLSFTKAINLIEQEIGKLQRQEALVDLQSLQDDLEKMKQVEKTLSTSSFGLREQEKALAVQEKSVRKLALVPCGDQFPQCLYIKESHEDKKTIEERRKQVELAASQLTFISEQFRTFQEKELGKKLSDFAIIQQKIKDLLRDKSEKESQLLYATKNLADITKWLTLATQEETSLLQIAANQEDVALLENKKKELKQLQNECFVLERKKADLLIDLGKNKANLEQLIKDQAECAVLLEKIRVLESVQAAFHKNGIPAIVLKTQLPAINMELSKLLGGLVDFNITFETEPGSNVMDVYIEDGHSRRVLELGSGMEKMIASIAIRVALTNLSSLPKSDLLVLDEGFNALDEEHVGKCMELLQTLKGYFKTVMVISHMQRVKEASDAIIEVVSTGQDSKVEV